MTGAYYNEIDPYAAQWLRNLIAAGHIAPGEVDERSIEDVCPADLAGFTQCHFFAGIGIWSYAARRAGWSDDRPLWTGSCPCQPFSAAGKGEGFADERHLWPAWHWLIAECRPDVVVGEQVAKAGAWLDLVSTDLENSGYAVAAADLPACGFGAFHIRQRFYFTAKRLAQPGSATGWRDAGAVSGSETQERGGRAPYGNLAVRLRAGGDTGLLAHDPRSQGRTLLPECADHRPAGPHSVAGGVADADSGQRDGNAETGRGHQQHGAQTRWQQGDGEPRDDSRSGFMADAASAGSLPGTYAGVYRGEEGSGPRDVEPERPGDVVWLPCRDGKYRPTQSGLFPLAHGATQRVGRLRAYGNGIHVETATAFMRAIQ